MFNIFRKKHRKLENWEKTTLQQVFDLLGDGYAHYIEQLGFIDEVGINRSDIPNLINCKYSVPFYKEFENELIEDFKVEGLIIGDLYKMRDVEVVLYFSDNIFIGYSTNLQVGSFQFNCQKIDISKARKKFWGDEGSSIVKRFLTKKELKSINIGDIYISNINGKDYYHLKELEDGDFLGFDQVGNFFILTHDPFEIRKIDRKSVADFLL
ncbi:hypothetical protein [Sphingobacterium detergens]|uniref:Uncharacterized protein n=1 Tax=Sphingobacterium detergens TaxID=1145106 RepID=A0A420BIX4_SPHD1|nr:hypothetical protein [Sphingobacterium detergens]RKE56663.1 hypothetical protein DFQ12_1529 [Sphingobacterium detergens]